ncbi:hypothetical protein FSP39_024854 [Pinctada imbricata]|uniref:DDE Tnp4 domain-containing protein n=1 Tax=Pinctada imbricata TaxID=66713 RepID=A0AA88YLS5_PINIB|nr:hypothetical protein FSP39_024854 [Pinctada imbricata]
MGKDELKSPKVIQLNLQSTGRSHSSCCVCKKRDVKFITLTACARHNAFIDSEVLLLAGARCCSHHVNNDGNLCLDALQKLKDMNTGTETMFNKTGIASLIKEIRSIAKVNEKCRLDFDSSEGLSSSDYEILLGIGKEDFNDLVSHVKGIRDTKNRSVRTCIAILLVKLRTGMSNRLLSTIFNMEKTSIRRAIKAAREEMEVNFIPHYLGFQHISREKIIEEHTRPLAQELFGSTLYKPVILVIDGTYIYIQKSNNFQFQRKSYSMHKNRPLVKPMIIVSTSGYIVSVLGPYHANQKNNDANILIHNILTNMEDIKHWIKEDDVLIVDRGFRDAVDFLEDMGVKTEMPAFLKKGQKQHTVEEANSSRLVTKIRWVVESVNGRLKLWKYLQNVVPNTQIPYIGCYVRLVAALCNKYKVPISVGEHQDDQSLAAKMKFLATQRNNLQERVIREEGLHRNVKAWKKMDASKECVPNFPKLCEEELRNITVGVYQLKLAKSYTVEHLNDDGDYMITINDDISDILRVRIQSRHMTSKTYMLWIEYNHICIKSWYCQCKAGARVVGACAHISSVLWYLCFARHNSETVNGVQDWSQYLEDASQLPQLVDESDSDEMSPAEE